MDEAQSVSEVARSYIVLRPLPLNQSIGEGPISGSEKARLIALPKKSLPKGARDRFATFVEKANATIKDLKESFLPGKEYSTKTQGYATYCLLEDGLLTMLQRQESATREPSRRGRLRYHQHWP